MRQLLKLVLPLLGKKGIVKLVFLGLLSGLWGFLMMNLVTVAVGMIMGDGQIQHSKGYTMLFILVIIFSVWTQRTLSFSVIKFSQQFFWLIRKKIISMLLKSDYESYVSKKDRVHAVLVNDVAQLTQVSMSLIQFCTSAIMALACLAYLVVLSWQLFLITSGISMVGVVIYHFATRKNINIFNESRNLNDQFMRYFNSILNGYKEIFMSPSIGSAIQDEKIYPIANEIYKSNTIALTGFLNYQITGQVLSQFLILSVLFYFSWILKVSGSVTVKFVFVIGYFQMAIETIMLLLPHFARARISINHLVNLENELAESKVDKSSKNLSELGIEFKELAIEGLEFKYNNSFKIGPVDLKIGKGEIVFIYGGNGSGKTTFINTLLGICKPDILNIKLNGKSMVDYSQIKQLTAVVFYDFYLFDEFYSVKKMDEKLIDFYLKLFEIDSKVQLEHRSFSTIDISTGQRKRLALIGALLEKKPLLILDEWAADQDPIFRKKFYTEIIPIIKKMGFSLIAITHDDKYYNCADKLYKMEEGRLQEEELEKISKNLMI